MKIYLWYGQQYFRAYDDHRYVLIVVPSSQTLYIPDTNPSLWLIGQVGNFQRSAMLACGVLLEVFKVKYEEKLKDKEDVDMLDWYTDKKERGRERDEDGGRRS